MFLLELRKGYYDDIDFISVYSLVLTVFLVALCVVALFTALICSGRSSQNETVEARNAQAAEFNARPEMERKIIASYLADGMVSGENYTMVMEDGIVDMEVYIRKAIIIAIIIVLVVTSAATAVSYVDEKDRCYYLADLPFNHLYGWVLFFSMFVFWPILLISRIHMFSVKMGWQRKEKQAVEELAQQELKTEEDARRSYKSNFSSKARRHYIQYRVKKRTEAYDHRKAEIGSKIKGYEDELRNYGQRIRETQREIGSAKAELNELSKVSLASDVARKEAAEEWRIISEMRGVSRITLLGNTICILVKVRVPYENHVYDFGDYEIFINLEKFYCRRIRSGVKPTATSTKPDYNETGGFCFGNRRDLIKEYVQHARMLEAITLMIDCLHSVNNGAEEYIPDCFRRVDTIESAKRRLRRRQKS